MGPFHTGEIITKSHIWFKKETYNIRCKSKDVNNTESEWASYQITITVIDHEYPCGRSLFANNF